MNTLKSVMLLVLLSVILIFFGNILGGQDGALVMFLISLGINFIVYWNCDKIALYSYNAKALSESEVPELFELVRQVSIKAQLPMPRIYIIPTSVPNAFATGRNPENAAIAVTEGILQLLDKDEMEGVLSHELSHIKNRDTLVMTLAASIATAIGYLANIAKWSVIFGGSNRERDNGGNAISLLVASVIAPIAAMILQMTLSRSREFLADESGAKICKKPLALASALQKLDDYAHRRVISQSTPAMASLFIINPLSGVRDMARLFSTHPSTEARVEKLYKIAREMRLI
ncbi:zinc metalloprotease HtpX [Dialister micraerophilus]|uniref:Protease HtpX homolog n=1 Tax=Dialister micraerophilus DSM 19965 TaxID=888062 RepID=F2BYF6_9FIRM|nr:zinc metalloprotease HtpX [Dialister micraerophilus]EGF12477.1 heat shock protein HtpX [Dialister micraerophilus DSM 19965]MDK8253578.1 zinc metalloprotease HtpX [Dialister micraerophilus]MDK8285135.1 zinc metalloprotease HtpX [Dialister micraerophilus]